jgi:hypothetical protein
MAEEMKEWQRGFPLEELKRYAAIFASAHKPHVYGAFGLAKEREVAEAMSDNRFFCNGKAGLIFRELKSGSVHHTYYGRPIEMHAGEVFISAFAAPDVESGTELLSQSCAVLAPGDNIPSLFPQDPRSIWLELFEEDHTAKACAAALGFAYVDTNILAGSEIKGLSVKGRHVPAACDKAEFATLAIIDEHFITEGERLAILAELVAFGGWAQHYSSYNKGGSWTALALHGYLPEDSGFIIKPDEMSRKWKEEHADLLANKCWPTVAAPKFPVTLSVASRIPGGKDRIRFMRLTPGGGELTRHADITNRDAGVADGRLARIHIPIVTNSGVVFTQWNSRGQQVVKTFPEGALCYLDQRQPHKAINGGTTERIHLVLDVESNPQIRALIAAGC